MTEPPSHDPRLTPARPDLAACSLRGKVAAARYVDGDRYLVSAGVLDLKRHPRRDAPLDTQLLHGEGVTVFDEEHGWGWLQAERDGYVGYAAMSGLLRPAKPIPPTHRVIVNRTFVYPAPDMKHAVMAALPLGALVSVDDRRGAFVKTQQAYIVASHVAPLETVAPDWPAIAEQMLGSPYLWGGKSPLGIDCSGLVQLSCALAGRSMPRDTDMQERVGVALPIDGASGGLARGDLVFWPGHVGIMLDGVTLLHANAYHMLVASEPLTVARDRIVAASGTAISSIRRVIAVM